MPDPPRGHFWKVERSDLSSTWFSVSLRKRGWFFSSYVNSQISEASADPERNARRIASTADQILREFREEQSRADRFDVNGLTGATVGRGIKQSGGFTSDQ
ncbi:hypothetical protein SEA_KUDEFRE_57 [Gordonia phage Kudefre]|uniref:Uncharacterized protein n=1 Tax=Gordonia phage Kudefre TaxID=2885975 RepID=A0AAE8Y674_9CAUD|nr:hypothetical protein L3Y24_gp057 [Gordonia phage Kudefre]UDL15287.1 hypothetical protein SEA_KUDEFRE_57 [Gordonia phage Kudefre]